MDIFLKRLRGLRAEAGATQTAVASAVGLSLNGYQKIERGETVPSLKTAMEIASYFGVSMDYLVGNTEVRYLPKLYHD